MGRISLEIVTVNSEGLVILRNQLDTILTSEVKIRKT